MCIRDSGCIVLGVGTAIHLEVSVFLPMLIFGILVQTCDRKQKVVAIRIASDARVFMVVTFVLAGAALDVVYPVSYTHLAVPGISDVIAIGPTDCTMLLPKTA